MNADTERSYARLLDHLRETATLKSCLSLLDWDRDVNLPPGGVELRARQLALLAGLVHERRCAPELGELLSRAQERAGPEAAANVREARREHERALRVPRALVEEIARVTTVARHAWVEARERNDFARFRPWLERVFGLARREADALGHSGDPYDALADKYEPGETAATFRAVLEPLRASSRALLDRIRGSASVPLPGGPFPVDAQRELVRRAVEAVGFDLARGRVDVSAHPFCSAAGPSDVRLTTRYEGRPFPDSVMSALHEAGHGLYEQGLLEENFGTPMGEACSFGIHESQSRLVENFVARSRGFWDRFLPVARPLFPEALAGVDAATFCRALNDVRPGLIRVDADEVTYNVHIVVRFELERAMLRGELAAGDLPGAWREAYRRELGITPPDDATGCLQDIHWSIGSVGYFPTYSLGNVYAAQFYAKAEEELGDLEAAYRRGEFAPLRGWLRERIHRHGKRLPPRRLVEEVTGRPPDAAFLARHLEARYAVPG